MVKTLWSKPVVETLWSKPMSDLACEVAAAGPLLLDAGGRKHVIAPPPKYPTMGRAGAPLMIPSPRPAAQARPRLWGFRVNRVQAPRTYPPLAARRAAARAWKHWRLQKGYTPHPPCCWGGDLPAPGAPAAAPAAARARRLRCAAQPPAASAERKKNALLPAGRVPGNPRSSYR
jgi:hypothetical protein